MAGTQTGSEIKFPKSVVCYWNRSKNFQIAEQPSSFIDFLWNCSAYLKMWSLIDMSECRHRNIFLGFHFGKLILCHLAKCRWKKNLVGSKCWTHLWFFKLAQLWPKSAAITANGQKPNWLHRVILELSLSSDFLSLLKWFWCPLEQCQNISGHFWYESRGMNISGVYRLR